MIYWVCLRRLHSFFSTALLIVMLSGCQSVMGANEASMTKPMLNYEQKGKDLASAKPSGIFISGGKYQEEPLLEQPFVDGALIRVRWNDLEPESGKLDWRYLDDEIAKVGALGKLYTLAIVGGPSTPSWLYKKGAKAYSFSLNNPYASKGRPMNSTLPLPWDEVYLQHWHSLIKKVGARYSRDPRLSLVHITLSSQNGFEMHLPYSRGPRDPNQLPLWKDFGFTEERYISAAKTTIDAFDQAFPGKFLDIEVHPIFESYRAPTELAQYGFKRMGSRFGLFGAWLNNRNLLWDQPLKTLMKEYSAKSFCNYQLIGNATRQLERVGDNGLEGAVQAGIDDGCHYYEIWEVDIKNKDFEPYLKNLNLRLKEFN